MVKERARPTLISSCSKLGGASMGMRLRLSQTIIVLRIVIVKVSSLGIYIYYTGGKMAIMWQKEDYNSFCSVQNMYVNLARLTLTITVVKSDGQYHS